MAQVQFCMYISDKYDAARRVPVVGAFVLCLGQCI